LQPESVGDVAKVTVQFDLDINGILKVQAVDRGSQKAESITVRAEHTHMSQKDLRSQPLPDITHDMEATTISDDIRREAEVLLKRARQVDAKALKDEIDAVDMALNEDDTDGLRDALEDLSDALFDLEDPI
jgi:molecular chaperone DnaK (HSP70)